MVALTLRLDDDTHEELRQESFDRRLAITEIIRERINAGGKISSSYGLKPPIKVTAKNKVSKEVPKLEPEVIANISVGPTRGVNGICKVHGTPLDSRGRCLVKGCKHG